MNQQNEFVIGKMGKGVGFHIREANPQKGDSYEKLVERFDDQVVKLDLSNKKQFSVWNPFDLSSEQKRDE
ncbi:hypothetical protein NIE88_10155 [Sporolactobacillus shoreicorticis]|uniref:Uncharacterized protein n=1 Tax=Sporolactobacillus shoreicorticis TaxID=1923877 RepID=A0ABW5S9G1_9BACL|nr:hypothetical protein [Sporolactobacillus shoreicorticis]MCO7126136.1 hypothetical protein [Sporolactobacillus shoreicorticis]